MLAPKLAGHQRYVEDVHRAVHVHVRPCVPLWLERFDTVLTFQSTGGFTVDPRHQSISERSTIVNQDKKARATPPVQVIPLREMKREAQQECCGCPACPCGCNGMSAAK
jgi:hypothetical protein